MIVADQGANKASAHPDFAAAFHKAPHHAGCSTADLVYEVGARRKTLSYLKNRVVEAVTRKQAKEEHAAHERLLAVARRAAERVRSKKSVVQVAPETLEGVSDDGRPAIPAGRKSLRIVN